MSEKPCAICDSDNPEVQSAGHEGGQWYICAKTHFAPGAEDKEDEK